MEFLYFVCIVVPLNAKGVQKTAHPACGMGGGGRLRAYNWSAVETIRSQGVGGLNNLVLAQEEHKDESNHYQNRQ